MKTHSPSPWKKVFLNGHWHISRNDGRVEVAKVTALKDKDQTLCNANLIESAPEMAQALEYARELIRTARRYFPKSIQNRDRFDLENTNAAIGKVLSKIEVQP